MTTQTTPTPYRPTLEQVIEAARDANLTEEGCIADGMTADEARAEADRAYNIMLMRFATA